MSDRGITWLALLLLAGLPYVAAADDTVVEAEADAAAPDVAEDAVDAPAPIAPKAMQAFAKALQQSFAERDPTSLVRAMDEDAFIDRCMEGLGLPPMFKGLLKQQRVVQQLSNQINAQIQQNGSYRLLGMRERDGATLPRFRLTSPQGLNYHDLILARNAAGEIKIIDMYVFVSGEMLSDTMRRSLLPAAAAQAARADDKALDPKDAAYVKALPEILKVFQAVQRGQHAEALKQYHTLPESVQQDKTLMLTRVMAAAQVGEAAYSDALLAYAKRYPGEANAELLQIDYYFLRQEWDKVDAAITALDKKIGGDVYLNQFRGNMAIAKGDVEQGKRLLHALVDAEPAVPDPYFILIDHALKAKQHAEVTRLLIAAHSQAGVRFNDLAAAPGFNEYVLSDEHKKWTEFQARQPQ